MFSTKLPQSSKQESPQSLMLQKKDVKIWKSVVAILAVVSLIIGMVVFAAMWLFEFGLFERFIHTDESAIRAIYELAWEMEMNGGRVSTDRVFEVLGEVVLQGGRSRNGFLGIAPSRGVLVLVGEGNGWASYINIRHMPLNIIDRDLDIDIESLRSYAGLTYAYLVELFGEPGTVTYYHAGIFWKSWHLPEIYISITTNRYGAISNLIALADRP